jgi:hypothetical protein
MISKGLNAMPALLKFLVLLALVLLASHANTFASLSLVAGNQVWVNHLTRLQQSMSDPTNEPICEPTKQMDLDAELPNNLSPMKTWVAYSEPKEDAELPSKITDSTNTQTCGLCQNKSEPESFADQPGINEEINNPTAFSDSSQNLWHMPTPINLDSSGLRCSSRTEVLGRRGKVYSNTTTLMDHDKRPTNPQITHLRLASPQRFSSDCIPFSTIFSFGRLSSLVHFLAVKVQASSPPKVSRHAFPLLAFEPVTSTNQNSFATIALKAIVEMQASAYSNKTCNAFGTLAHEHQCLNITQPIFQLIDVSITNFQLILIVDLFQLKQEMVNFSLSNAFSIANLDPVFEGVQQVSLIQRFVSSPFYSKSFKLIDVSVPNKNEMCGAS